MWLIDQLAEARIEEASRRGEFDHLPGSGERLQLDDDPLVAEELRVAYRVLKNAGCAPPEVALLAEIRQVEQLMSGMEPGEGRSSGAKRLNLLRAQLGARSEHLDAALQYSVRIMDRLAR